MRALTVLLFLVVSMVACKDVGSAGVTAAPSGDIVEITGTVRHVSVEGGFYGIIGEGGEKYDPTNLSQEFAVEGLRVKVQAQIMKGVASLRMWGNIIKIIKIEKVD
jgi:hypothetical protein